MSRPENSAKDKISSRPWPGWVSLKRLLPEIGQRGLFGTVLILGLLWFFAELIEAILRNESANLDNNFGLWVHSFDNPLLDALFLTFTTLGNGLVILSLTAITFGLLLWRKSFRSAWLLLLAVSGGILINQALKFFLQRPRPQLWADMVEKPDSYSFPSGHATMAFCYFGLLMWLGFKFLKHSPGKILWAVVMSMCIAMVGLSRIYFGVHYLTDVVGGYISGSLWLALILSGNAIYNRLISHSPLKQIIPASRGSKNGSN